MSGFHDRDGIVVIAATNRLDTLDDALTRPGRFDRLVEIGLPDLNARKKILKLHGLNKQLAADIDFDALAKSTSSFSGAMLGNLLNEAAIFAANENCRYIQPEHIDKAFFTVIAGAEKSDTSCITQKDRRITAYHEAGHALVTSLLMPDSYIARVTIIPSTRGAGGFSLSIPKDSLYTTKQSMLSHLKVLLAGRASEELIFGPAAITTGASNDIEKASGLILDYLNKYGMDEKFGLFNMGVLHMPASSDLVKGCRERMKSMYDETLGIVTEHLDLLHGIAELLLEKENLTGEDIEELKKKCA
jgi:cell division protease FtsH